MLRVFTRPSAGTATRTKIDLVPEHIRHLPRHTREVWSAVATSLRSEELRSAFVRKFAPQLRRRFGRELPESNFWPLPTLTRDFPGYHLPIHSDALDKGITVQFYLPKNGAIPSVGTVLYRREGTAYIRDQQLPFTANTGYAFAVADDTHHAVDEVKLNVESRDSILLTYYVDTTFLDKMTNRGKRAGNAVLAQVRALLRRINQERTR